MKFLTSILIIFFIHTVLYASTTYKRIWITQTKNKSDINLIKTKLAKMHIGTYVKESHGIYKIYSFKYKNYDALLYDTKRVRRVFKNAKMLKITETFTQKIVQKQKKDKLLLKPKKQKVIQPQKDLSKKQKNPTVQKTFLTQLLSQDKNKVFMTFSFGANSISATTNNILAKSIDNNSFGYRLEGGYQLNKNLFFTLSYLNSFTHDIFLDSIYLGINYNYKIDKKYSVYAGVVSGISLLRLDKYKDAQDSKSILYGVQFGTIYLVDKNIDLFLAYQPVKINHKVEFRDTNLYIQFNVIHNIEMGIKYNF